MDGNHSSRKEFPGEMVGNKTQLKMNWKSLRIKIIYISNHYLFVVLTWRTC